MTDPETFKELTWQATRFEKIISFIGLILMIVGLIMACFQQQDFWS
jgi:glucose uptake protein GlcU